MAETELELSHIEEDEIDHSKDHTRLLKTNSEHIFLIETSNFMKYIYIYIYLREIREKSSFEGLLLQLTHCFQFLNPLLGNDILLCHLLEQNVYIIIYIYIVEGRAMPRYMHHQLQEDSISTSETSLLPEFSFPNSFP